MELLESPNEYLIVDGEKCLRCSRITGQLEAANALALAEQSDPICLGIIYGVIGRLEFTANGPSYLVVIKERKQIASHPLNSQPIYKIEKVVAIPLTNPDSTSALTNGNGNGNVTPDLQLSPCPKHRNHFKTNGDTNAFGKTTVVAGFSLLQKGQKKMAKATVDSLKFVTNKMNVRGIGSGGGTKLNQVDLEEKERIRMERRLLLEFLRMFNESESFYYCPTADITNSIQRLLSTEKNLDFASLNFDDYDARFIWNSYMLHDLIKQDIDARKNGKISTARQWIVPIIQGFVGVENCAITLGGDVENASPAGAWNYSPVETFQFRLMLISRRSIHRAGTRYIKRGIDSEGHCANYVETEQILLIGDYGHHAVTFVQIRGSVPVYWSQPGYKYKPAPKLERPKSESIVAFRKHFKEEMTLYSNIVVVNLVEQIGKEKVLSDAYLDHVLDLDAENLAYVGFDFHDHCRGLKFENVAILTLALEDFLNQHRFCWVDKGIINCSQTGVFRVNCVDCLDRTNVVQAALGRAMLELQLRKFGLLPPEQTLPPNCIQAFQLLWASNGDAISRQYTGTAALKGDFTRTGQRNLAGVMKDGYNSANRYYLCHMKDAHRQAAIDAFLGRRTLETDKDLENLVKSKLESGGMDDEASWLKEKDEQLRLFVRDCEKLVVPDGEVVLGSWALINADPGTGDETEEDMDTCVVLTRNAYYVADYDEDLDKFVDFQRIPLEDVLKIEAGPMTVASVLGVPKAKATCLRIYYKVDDSKDEYFHVWRSGSTRLFNNLAIAIKNSEEADEYMKAIAEQFRVALELISRNVDVDHPPKLERKKSKLPTSKLTLRRHGAFGAPMFLSSLSSIGGGMKSFSNRVSAAFHSQGGHGMRFFRLNSALKKNGNQVDSRLMDSVGQSPLVKLENYDSDGQRGLKITSETAVHQVAGVLFGAGVTEVKNSHCNVRRKSKSDGDICEKNTVEIIKSEPSCELLLLDSPRPCSSPGTTDGDSTIISPLHPTAPSPNASLLVPVTPANPNRTMKTSHSESCFKPTQSGPVDPAAMAGQRALAVSQTSLNKAEKPQVPTSASFKFPLLFKKKQDEVNGVGEKRKFLQFEDRIQNSQTKFILL